MARKPTGNPVGRPEIEINWEIFESLCNLQCTQSEIASVLKVSVDTLTSRVKKRYGEDFSDIYKRYSEGGKSSLRRTQFKLAQKSAAMAIWLGKHWLGQTDVNKETIGDIVEAVLDINERNRHRTANQS